MIQRRMEREGTERMSAKNIKYNISDDDVLTVSYKVSRSTKKEIYQMIDLEKVISDLEGTDQVILSDLAIYEPHLYWLFHYHCDGDVEDGMARAGILQTKRRRSRK